MEWHRGEHVVSDEPGRLDRARVWRFLAQESYWAGGIPEDTVAKALDHSLCFGLYRSGAQVGFARVVTDRATFAYLGDVYVLPELRGRGLGKWLIDCVMAHPDLQGLRRWMLVTKDAHGLYSPRGFAALKAPERHMERHDPDVYLRSAV
jgi:GNAT superfamily N-acetyltransferase